MKFLIFVLTAQIFTFVSFAENVELSQLNWSFNVEILKECFTNGSYDRCDIPV